VGLPSRKITVEIEKLLQWAYREELPKQIVGGLTGWEHLVMLGTRVDTSRGDSNFPVNLGPPHPDALLIDHAVRSLEDTVVDWRQSRATLAHGLDHWGGPEQIALKRLQFQTAGLLTLHARMGTRPPWDLGPLQVAPVRGRNGKPVIQWLDDEGHLVEGRTKARHYGPRARCPLQYEPAPADVIFARAEYAVWHAGLCLMAETICAWNRTEHMPTPPTAAEAPWVIDTERKSRILRAQLIPA
jgi:hypothetical protein